jgi:aminobenzoyl-glutamate utilization protein B
MQKLTARRLLVALVALFAAFLVAGPDGRLAAQRGGGPPQVPALDLPPNPRLDALKKELVADIDARRQFTQQMVDMVFSYSELGFQELETQRYLTDIMVKEGFDVERGTAGMPTGWLARYGNGHPIIALGTDIDGLPTTNQTPGVVTRKELVAGAPGHGEGHNAGPAILMTAGLALKRIMQREKLPGTILLWPGVAEEPLGGKAYFARAGVFKDVDAVIFLHVAAGLSTTWGDGTASGLVSVEYTFTGSSAHAAGAPWAGRSALDAVELMNVGWNYRREHLRTQQRSHYVITNGGDQPNVVPPSASVWYFFRELDYNRIKELWALGDKMANAAAMMTDTTVTSRVLGSAWPQHGNRPIAQAAHANILQVGMPQWSEADQQFARAFQRAMGVAERGLTTSVGQTLSGRESIPDSEKAGGGSDDIGDVMWSAPAIRLTFPSNIPGAIAHHWSSSVAMATPVAHKGATQGAKVTAMTALDLVMQPELVKAARDYFVNVQKAPQTYKPLIRPEDQPAIWLNKETMDRFKPELRKYYYDPARFKSYLDQLGVPYPPPMPASR